MVYVFLSIIMLTIVSYAMSNLISIYGGIVFVGTPKNVFDEAIKLANPKKNEVFYELGSGLGSNLISVSGSYDLKIHGIEISPFLYLISILRTLNNKKISQQWGNFRKIDLHKADIIYCYLSVKLMKELLPRFKKELKPGSRVISYVFLLPQLKPDSIKIINAKKIYLYRF